MKNTIFLTIILTVMQMTSGCKEAMSDLIWTQEGTVKVKTTNLNMCLETAVEKVPGIVIDRTLSSPGDLVLKAKFEKPLSSVGVYVRRMGEDTVQVLFAGKDAKQTNEQRIAITPVLTAILNSIQNGCGK